MINIRLQDNLFHKANGGSQAKWNINDIQYKADDFNHEGLAETLVSDILKKSNVEKYATDFPEQIKYNGKIYSGCGSGNFLKDGQRLIESTKLLKQYGMDSAAKDESESIRDPEASIKGFVTAMKNITGLDSFDIYLTKMFELDMIILNPDRHFGNITVLKTPFSYDYAPVFDQGRAFALRDDLWNTDKSVGEVIESVEARPFSGIFSKQVKILEGLSGGRYFQTSYGKDDLIESLDKCSFAYSDEILSRAERVFIYQMQRNMDYFIGKERNEILEKYKREIDKNISLPLECVIKDGYLSLATGIHEGIFFKLMDLLMQIS